MTEKKKVSQRSVQKLRNWRLSDDELDDGILGGSTVSKTGGITGNESGQTGKVPMTKMMMRLPRALALEFQQTYLQLAALHLQEHGTKLYVQDCHIEMVRDWLKRQKVKLTDRKFEEF